VSDELKVQIKHLQGWQEYYITTTRDIDPDDRCENCGGSGIAMYDINSTWRGEAGGWTVTVDTSDVCDQCWGSGNRHKPWPSHRRFEEMEKELERLRG
jgi:hypothetical protein